MKFESTSIGGSVEILASKDFQAVPVCVQGEDTVLAGTPLTMDGEQIVEGTADGVLLYDVNVDDNPNGALVVAGIIDVVKVAKHNPGANLNSVSLPDTIILRNNVRAVKTNANLSALSIGALTLTPTFDPDVTVYTATTSNAADAVNATAADGGSIVIKNGATTVTNGGNASWSAGENTLTVTVTAEGGNTKTYTVVVTKE